MTLTTTQTREYYAGDGTTTTFPVPFPFYGPDEMRVYSTDGTGVQVTLTRGLDYSVLGGNGTPGTIVATVAPAIGTTLAVVRATAQTQQVAFANADPFPASTHERALDRLTALAQEASGTLERTIRVPPGEAAALTQLPGAAARAGLALTFDLTGQPTASVLAAGSTAISAAMVPVVGAATVAGARLAMGGRRYIDVVKDFGADPSGTTDTQAAIQAAINSVASGEVYLASGAYGVSTGITMKPNVTILGEDPLLTQLVARANNAQLLQYTAAAAVGDFVVRGLGLNGGGFSNVKGIRLDGTDAAKRCAFVTLQDVAPYLCERGIDLRWCSATAITNLFANACAVGIYLDTCENTDVVGGKAMYGTSWGIYVDGASSVYGIRTNITGFATRGQLHGLGAINHTWGTATGCSFIGAASGAASFVNSANWQMTGCQFEVGGGVPANAGLVLDTNCYGIQVANSFFANNTYGAVIRGVRNIVKGCYFAGNSNRDIEIAATRSVIAGNVCDSTGVVTSIAEVGGADYNAIHGNVTNGTVTIIGANSKTNGDNLVY